MVIRFPNLKFNGEDDVACDQDCVEATADAWNNELQEERSLHADKSRLQDSDLKKPGIPLGQLHREVAVCDKSADDFFRRRAK